MIDGSAFLVIALMVSMTAHTVMGYFAWKLAKLALGEKETVYTGERYDTTRLESIR